MGGLSSWIGAISSLSALLIGLVTALWAYTKFVIERGLLPPSQFEIECTPVGDLHGKTLLEILLHLKNLGTSTLIVTDLRVDVLYLEKDDEATLFDDHRFGRLRLGHSVRSDLLPARPPQYPDKAERSNPRAVRSPPIGKKTKGSARGVRVVPYDTFVQAGVSQVYTFPTAVPDSVAYVLVWSSFLYAQKPKALQRGALWISRRLGLIQFSLRHVTAPHTVERLFNVNAGRP